MKKHKQSQSTEDVPFGIWVQKGEFEHLYGEANASVNMKTKIAFLHLSCDCGVEKIELGMNLEVLKKVASALNKAVSALEGKEMGGKRVH